MQNYSSLTFNELAAVIGKMNRDKGFWEDQKSAKTRTALIVGEIFEALEADRKGRVISSEELNALFPKDATEFDIVTFENRIKDTIGDEWGDAIIRMLDCHANHPEMKFFKEYSSDDEEVVGDTLTLNNFKMLSNQLNISNKFEFGDDVFNAATLLINGQFMDFVYYSAAVAAVHGFDLVRHIELKLQYNATRAYKHGKNY